MNRDQITPSGACDAAESESYIRVCLRCLRILHLTEPKPLTTMLPSIFRTAERNLVLEYLDEWKKLKGSGKGMDNEGDLLSLKDELVNQIIQDLFNHFPERDLTRSPQHPLVWEQADRDLLHAVRQAPSTT